MFDTVTQDPKGYGGGVVFATATMPDTAPLGNRVLVEEPGPLFDIFTSVHPLLAHRPSKYTGAVESPTPVSTIGGETQTSSNLLNRELAMKTSNTHDQRIAKMSFASVYPMYLAKVKKKGRTRDELHQVIQWLTGSDDG